MSISRLADPFRWSPGCTDTISCRLGWSATKGCWAPHWCSACPARPRLRRVQDAGSAWQIESTSFIEALEFSLALRSHLKRYLHVVMCQSTQTAACTRFHVVEARLARWLLMTRDRAHSDQFHSTHESLASILGVRRAGVTHAAGALQQQRLISYSRGEITVLDLKGLETAACACYFENRSAYSRTMA